VPRPSLSRRRLLLGGAGTLGLGAAGGAVALDRARRAEIDLYSTTVAFSAPLVRRLVPPSGIEEVLPGTRVVGDSPYAGRLVEDEEAWLEGSARWTRAAHEDDLLRSALLDLRVLSAGLPAAVAGWSQRWRYAWPRDTAFVAAALARVGRPEEAVRQLAFLQAVQGDDGWFQARYDVGTGLPPDGRGVQLDGSGWVLWAADQIAVAIELEGPDSVAAVFLEPVQNSGGCFPPPPGYLERVRQICDEYDVLFVADETITAFGRIGDHFAMKRFGVDPDIITCAKGLTSGYAPLGAMIVHDRLFEPFLQGTNTFLHGYTWGGHPVATAVALANLDLFDSERIMEHVRSNETGFRAVLEGLKDLPIVGDVRGAGYFYGIEMVKDKATKETFNEDESERLLRGFLSKGLFDAGLYCRADDRGDPVIQLAPPLICDQSHFDEIGAILRDVLTQAWSIL